MKKRYTDSKVSGYKQYSDFYYKYQIESVILNAGANRTPNIHSIILWDKENIEIELATRIGDKEGFYFQNGQDQIAYIPYLQIQLSEIEKRFEIFSKRKVNQGFERPTEYPKELLDEKMKHEARLDISIAEVEKLQKKLKELNDVKEILSDDCVLQFGLICSGCFHGIGTSWYDEKRGKAVLDGQYLTMVPEGFLIIDDERSPYNQMKVSDYHRLAKQWVKTRLENEQLKFKTLQKEFREKGLPVPQQPAATGSKKVSKSNLPKWPDWALKYVHEPKEEDSSTIRRTKR